MEQVSLKKAYQTKAIYRWIPLWEVLGVFGTAIFLLWIAGSWLEPNPIITHAAVWTTYLLVMIIIWRLQKGHRQRWALLGLDLKDNFSWRTTTLRSLMVFVGATLAFILVGMLAANLGWAPQQADLSGYDFLKGNLPLVLLSLLAVYISASFGEEVVFRGFLITRLHRLFEGFYPVFWSVLISGIIFGLAHFSWGLLGIIQTAAMGWTLGYFYLRYGRNLWNTILAHAYMDTILILQMY